MVEKDISFLEAKLKVSGEHIRHPPDFFFFFGGGGGGVSIYKKTTTSQTKGRKKETNKQQQQTNNLFSFGRLSLDTTGVFAYRQKRTPKYCGEASRKWKFCLANFTIVNRGWISKLEKSHLWHCSFFKAGSCQLGTFELSSCIICPNSSMPFTV